MIKENDYIKLGLRISVILVPVILICWIVFYPPKGDMSSFSWTQKASQNDWKVSLPEQEGFDHNTLIDLHNHVTLRKSKRIQSLLITRNDQLVFEQYYPVRSSIDGTPMPDPYPSAPDTYHQMRSVTKTITSTLIGNLLYKKEISDIDTPLFDYYANENILDLDKKKSIKLKHALDFNSGLDWKEWEERNSDAMNMWLSDDPYSYILGKGIAYQPGEKFVYQGAMSVLLGGVIENVTGMNLRQYAETALFNPLEISNYDWFAHEATGDYLGSSGLYLRSRDFAKLGQLYLNKGLWNGERIFSEQWAEESLKPKGKFWPEKTIEYGHNWWFPFITKDGEQLTIAGMRGAGGQEMFIIPDLELTFVITSGAYIDQDEDYPLELIVNYILPSIGIDHAQYQSKI